MMLLLKARKQSNVRRVLAVLFALALTNCAGKFKHSLQFNATEPLRVVVLPFYQVDEHGALIQPDNEFLIDNVALVYSKLKDTPGTFVRNLVQNELAKSGLDVLSPAVVDANLSHNGFDKLDANPPFDLEKVKTVSAAELCSKIFSCDAVLYGKVTRWSRNYYGIQSVSTVGIDLKLVAASDGKILFESSAEDSDSRGITKGPTGFSNLVIEPLRGLDNEIITDLARNTVTKMLSPLKVENRPEFLNSSPPAVFASAHDATSGKIFPNKPLTVIAYGSPKKSAAFSIGTAIENVPMIEKDAGHYIGKFLPLSTDSFVDQPVIVSITDEFGRTTEQKLGTGAVTLSKG